MEDTQLFCKPYRSIGKTVSHIASSTILNSNKLVHTKRCSTQGSASWFRSVPSPFTHTTVPSTFLFDASNRTSYLSYVTRIHALLPPQLHPLLPHTSLPILSSSRPAITPPPCHLHLHHPHKIPQTYKARTSLKDLNSTNRFPSVQEMVLPGTTLAPSTPCSPSLCLCPPPPPLPPLVASSQLTPGPTNPNQETTPPRPSPTPPLLNPPYMMNKEKNEKEEEKKIREKTYSISMHACQNPNAPGYIYMSIKRKKKRKYRNASQPALR